ncbi:MAG: hypothetical protein IID31_12140 [Planctomycetes bacterium]|nr:hypothetical protein [Planctomycetota bacterium]
MNNKTICSMRFAQALMTLTLALLTARPALAQHQLWIRQFGTSERDQARALMHDGTRGVIVAGYTEGSLGGRNAGGLDAFLARYDSTGDRIWIRQFGTGVDELARALAPDGAGGVILAGYTEGSLAGPNAGGRDVLLARYDGEGNRLWIRQFGTSGNEKATALAPAGAGGVFVAGYTRGSLGGPNAGDWDAFVARYDGEGNRLWISQFGTSREDFAIAVAPDGSGGVFVAGSTRGILGDPSQRCTDVFLARYDGAGKRIWIRQFGTSDCEEANALAPDGAGGVMVAGWTGGSLGGLSAGSGDAFLARYDSAGNRLWIRQFGTSVYDRADALAPDGAGGVIITGRTSGSLGGPNVGSSDGFLARFNSKGDRLWVRQFGTSAWDQARALAPDGAGGVMVAGYTTGSLGGPNAGDYDVFLARYEIDSCYPDCDRSTGNGVLDIFDFLCFQNSFVIGDPFACDCDTSTGPGVCDLSDFLCFQKAFMAGCP